MPVFKFQMQPKGKPFEILEDHFLTLWKTSNMDLSIIEARIAKRNAIIKDIFDSHSSWFKHVYKVLYTSEGNVPIVKFTNENSQVNAGSGTNHR
jgi:NADPH-dependent 7-cyano-7-deazaguanine reductase QueF